MLHVDFGLPEDLKCIECGNEIEMEYVARKNGIKNKKCFFCTLKNLKDVDEEVKNNG
jgi:hypothetical protein